MAGINGIGLDVANNWALGAAPLLQVEPSIGKAYITASANYLEVVCFHSVVMFIPLFIAWACILSRYQFRPFAVFLLFGLTGTLAEAPHRLSDQTDGSPSPHHSFSAHTVMDS